jgi:hypothetical protein
MTTGLGGADGFCASSGYPEVMTVDLDEAPVDWCHTRRCSAELELAWVEGENEVSYSTFFGWLKTQDITAVTIISDAQKG